MSIGPDARRWFLSHHGKSTNKVHASKYYLPDESWPKKHVWWVQIPPSAIDPALHQHVNILCQVASGANDFHYLRVPVTFILKHQEKFHRIVDKIDFYLSAEQHNLFWEIRGIGNLDFSPFIVQSNERKF
jgi:hypothetical protein